VANCGTLATDSETLQQIINDSTWPSIESGQGVYPSVKTIMILGCGLSDSAAEIPTRKSVPPPPRSLMSAIPEIERIFWISPTCESHGITVIPCAIPFADAIPSTSERNSVISFSWTLPLYQSRLQLLAEMAFS
jgi:hypothetical protein